MPKRKNYPTLDPIEIIKNNNRQVNELLQENKQLRKEVERFRKLAIINSDSAKNITRLLVRLLGELYAIKNNIIIATNSRAEMRDYYIETTLFGLDYFIKYLNGELDKLEVGGYWQRKDQSKTLEESLGNNHSSLPLELLRNDSRNEFLN